MTKAQKRVFNAAMRWFNRSGGFFYERRTYVKLPALAKKLEEACAAARQREKRRRA